MKTVKIYALLLAVMLLAGCKGAGAELKASSDNGAFVRLVPDAPAFDLEEVRRGSVGFTASIRNGNTTAIRIAHPSVCLPADYKEGETRRLRDYHGKSEILLKIKRPDGSEVTLRDGYFHYFDPGNVPVLTIAPHGTGSFYVGWFFLNERGSWEKDEEAAKVFLLKGRYKIRILLRNVFPKAALYNVITRENNFVDVWTGEMESAEITIEVK